MQRRAREDGAWIRVAFIKKYAGTVLGAALLLALAVFGITYRNEIWAVLTQQDARDAFIAFVHDNGFLGLLAFLGLQVLQVVVAVLPGEPVELMAGLLYGTWGGLALCLLGVGLSSAAVYYCVRAAGARLSLIHISEPTRQAEISYAVFCLKKKKENAYKQCSACT